MLTILYGRSGSGKSQQLLNQIVARGASRSQILIVPEQHSYTTERALCQKGGTGVSLYGEVLSFTRLSNRVFGEVGGAAITTLDEGGRMLLMRRALQGVTDQLKVYHRPSKKPAFLTDLIATVDELKSYGISAEDLWRAGSELDGGEGERLLDLSLIFGAYEALTALQGADPKDRLTRLAEGLELSGWGMDKDFYIDSFTDFMPQEREVLAVLLAQANSVTIALTCDHLEEDEGGTGIFSPTRRTAQQLTQLAQKCRVPVETTLCTPKEWARSEGLAYLEAHLFDGQPQPTEGGEALSLFEGGTPYSEVEYCASRMIALARDEGYRYRDMVVALADATVYGPLVETIFPRYGIPYFYTRMTDVLQKPVFTLVTAALRTAAGGYLYEDLFAYLKTGLTSLPLEEVDLLENYALTWNLKGGRWTQKADWSLSPSGYSGQKTEEDLALLQRLDSARRAVVAPLETLRTQKEHTGEGYAKALYRFLEEIQFPQQLAQRGEMLERRGELAMAAEDSQLWDILCNGLEQCAQILADVPMELEEFSTLFSLVLSQYDVGSIPISLDRAFVGDMPRLAHRHCKALFLLGVDDSALPNATPAPGLLNDIDRARLAGYGLETALSTSERLYREMTTAYETVALPSQHLHISWAAMSQGGEGQRPSFLIHKMQVLFPQLQKMTEGDLDATFRLCAPRPALEGCGTYPEVKSILTAMEDFAPYIKRLEDSATWKRGSLSKDTTYTLYGKKVPMSASRMDSYRSCHFSYFMQYGLKAKERQSAQFQAPEYGTFIHYVLEHTLKETLTPDKKLVHAIVDRYVNEELGGLEEETPRFRYLFQRLKKSVWAVVSNVSQELSASDFKPISFELAFGRGGDLPPVEFQVEDMTVSISGLVDRIDGWVKDDKLYLRVIDYKTGRKSFDLTEIWNGLGLQMLLYLFTLGEQGKELYSKEVVPAGVLYLPARDAVVGGSRTMEEGARLKEVDKALRRRGLILNDPAVIEAMERIEGKEGRFLPLKVSAKSGITGDALVSAQRLGKLQKHTNTILQEIGQELVAGNITADPYWRSANLHACQWCPYQKACHFEEGRGGDRRRYLPTVKGEAFWTAVEAQEGGD